MIPPHNHAGHLPPGRHCATLDEVLTEYDVGRFRHAMLDELTTFTAVASETLGGVAALWLGGSFFSADPTPSDIDLICLVETATLQAALAGGGGAKQFVLDLQSRGHGVRFRSLDVGLLAVPPRYVGRVSDADPATSQALGHRGYWDALWSRTRGTVGRSMERGYLEVIIDGYS